MAGLSRPLPKDGLYAFAGIDGAGKTSLIDAVARKLRASGRQVSISKAYTDEHKRTVGPLLRHADNVEIMLYFQAFFRGQRNHTRAALERGDIVLADRWIEANQAFRKQHDLLADRLGFGDIFDDIVAEGLQPKCTFYLRVPVATAMSRTGERGASYFDAKPISYHEPLIDFYEQKASTDSSWIVLDAEHGGVEKLAGEVVAAILESL